MSEKDSEFVEYDDEVRDKDTVLAKDATTAEERRAALIWCLTTVWVQEDVAQLQRWDDASWHGWMMSRV